MQSRCALLALCAAVVLGASPASAATVWNLDIHHHETHFPPGGEGQYWFDVNNVGDSASAGLTTLTINLPPGITRRAVLNNNDRSRWPGAAPAKSEPARSSARPPARSPGTASVAPSSSRSKSRPVPKAPRSRLPRSKAVQPLLRRRRSSRPRSILSRPASASSRTASSPTSSASDGLTTEREAGAHPELLTVPFDFNSITPNPDFRVRRRSPRASATSSSTCRPASSATPPRSANARQAEFTVVACPASSQVGRIDLTVFPLAGAEATDSSRSPPRSSTSPTRAARSPTSASSFAGNPVHIKASLDPANHYAITSRVPDDQRDPAALQPEADPLGRPGRPQPRLRALSRASLDGSTPQRMLDRRHAKALPHAPLAVRSTTTSSRLHHYDSWQNTGRLRPRDRLHDAGPDDRLRQAALRTRRRNRTDRQAGKHADRPRRPRQGRPERKPQRPGDAAGQALHGAACRWG